MRTCALIPEDEPMLETTIEAGAALEPLAKGIEKIPNKRKGGRIFIQYSCKRRKSKSFNSHVTLNLEAQVDDVMSSDCLANNVGSNATTSLVDKSAHGCHETIQSDYFNGSMRDDGLCKLNENYCFLLTDNLMTFFDTDTEPNDDSHMHNADSDDSSVTEVEYSSLFSFSSKDYINCVLNTEDTIDDIPDSQLVDSDEDVLEDSSFDDYLQDDSSVTEVEYSSLFSFWSKDYINCLLNTEDTIDDIPDSQLVDSDEDVLEDSSFDDDLQDNCYCEDDSFDGDRQDVCHCEDDGESISISHLDPVRLIEEYTICILNTEDPEIPCNDNIFLRVHSSPSARPQIDTESIDPESSFSQTQMDDPNLSPEFDSANPHVDCTPKLVSMDHDLSISDPNDSDSFSDLSCSPDIKYAIPSASIRPQAAKDSIDPASCFAQSQMDGPGPSSEYESASPHVSCTLKSVSVDHNPSVSDHKSDSDLPCFPDIEDPEISSPIRPQAATDLIDPTSCFTRSQMDDPDLSSEFDYANSHVDCVPKSVLMDHNPSLSDHKSDSDLPCVPAIDDPEVPSSSVRPQTATDSIDPASYFTQSQMDGPGLSPEFESAGPHFGWTLKSVSMDHNPSSISDHNSDTDPHCFLDVEDPEIRSASLRLQTALDSIDLTSCFTMNDPDLSLEYDYANPHAGCTFKFVSVDHNPSISDHNSHSDLVSFPDIEHPEIPSPSVRPQTATDSIDPASCFTRLQMDGPDLSCEIDSAHPNVGKYVSVDHDLLIADHNNSDNDSDLPCFLDIDALILKLDFEYAQESWITNEVKRGTYKHYKPLVNRLEKRAMSSMGAFAVFYSHRFNYYIKKTEVTIGRSTDDTEVDIDLRKETHANMISRQQATIKMENDGTFTLKNFGKGLILMNGKSIAPGQVAALGSSCLLQIRGMEFMFQMNDRYVKWYLDNIVKKTQGKFTAFEWSVS